MNRIFRCVFRSTEVLITATSHKTSDFPAVAGAAERLEYRALISKTKLSWYNSPFHLSIWIIVTESYTRLVCELFRRTVVCLLLRPELGLVGRN